ncbi:MAG: hypothetical protein OXG82_08505 [Gammaproteobacteria bacterium]|nr:hypothetical protein [Gammaproteobacteria bacterium]
MPDADFASTYSPAIAAVFGDYVDLPDPAAARRALLHALKAALKRRRAYILPRFTQAEDSWRIRECASYAVAIAILVEHACALLGHADRSEDAGDWARILRDPQADPDSSSARASLFHAIVPAQGRRWIAREPLVQTLISGYFTDTAPNELRDTVGPVVAGFGRDRQPTRTPPDDDRPTCLEPVPPDPARPSTQNQPGVLLRTVTRIRELVDRRPQPHRDPARRRASDPKVTETVHADHGPRYEDAPPPVATSKESRPQTNRFSEDEPALAMPAPPLPDAASSSPPPAASRSMHLRSAPASKRSRHRRTGSRVADLLDGLPAATLTNGTGHNCPTPAPAGRPDIGDHGATAARIGHAPDYARWLVTENRSRASQRNIPFPLPGPAPDVIGEPLQIAALFPAAAHATNIDPGEIAAWTAFRAHIVEALRSDAQSANEERSLIHLLDVGAFLVWPQVALPFADERRITSPAIKSAMRAARVLAVNRADRQEDRHAFPALTGDPTRTCHGLITLPEYLWPDASMRPTSPSTFVRPPAIYGQRYRRPH